MSGGKAVECRSGADDGLLHEALSTTPPSIHNVRSAGNQNDSRHADQYNHKNLPTCAAQDRCRDTSMSNLAACGAIINVCEFDHNLLQGRSKAKPNISWTCGVSSLPCTIHDR